MGLLLVLDVGRQCGPVADPSVGSEDDRTWVDVFSGTCEPGRVVRILRPSRLTSPHSGTLPSLPNLWTVLISTPGLYP